MLKLSHVFLQLGGKPLFEDLSLSLHAGQKVGIVGANGSGKTTLFHLLQGGVHADAGEVELPPRWRVAEVAQETPALPVAAVEYALDGDSELRQVEAELRVAEAAHDGHRLAELHARFEALDGYAAPARVGRLLAGLGFAPGDLDKPVADFSGGWRVRLNLARALMGRSDLLLLDEPTNHLDLDAVLWLEQWLRSYPGTLLLISHDREVLDNVVDYIAHLEQRQLRLYRGNYSEFEAQRAARLSLQQAAYTKQQREIAHLQGFIDRFRAKATKARQAQSRLKALERLERVAAAHGDTPFEFAFGAPDKLPHPLVQLDKVATGYDTTPVLQQISLTLQPGDRLGLLGPNGAGKSTLIKLLAGLLPPLAGRVEAGLGLAIGYFAQHQLEQLRPDWSPLQHLQRLASAAAEQALRDFLGGFGFRGDQALAAVAPFSGGEKARLALALLVWQRPNLLLLDEPTNHLDLDMRHALTLALQDYGGALVLVSHDRHLLRTTTDRFVLVEGGRVQRFDGDLEDYRTWLSERQRTAGETDEVRPNGVAARREQRRLEAERRQWLAAQRRPLEKQLQVLEQRLETLTADQIAIENALANPQAYHEANKARLKELLLRQGGVGTALAEVEEQWLALQEALEALGL
jgi:ATP-binding cassette subfamily F protein 3